MPEFTVYDSPYRRNGEIFLRNDLGHRMTLVTVIWPCGDSMDVTPDTLRSAIDRLGVLERHPDAWQVIMGAARSDACVFARVEDERLFVTFSVDEVVERNSPADWDEFKRAATEVLGVTA